jgi:iron complex transport system substrate-binding protein
MSPSPRPSFRVLLVLLSLVAILGGACSSAGASPRVALASPTPVPTAAPTATLVPTASPTPVPAFPVSLTDDEGTAVKLDAEPQKIVALTPAATETLFAIGVGDRVVATDDGSDYPAEAVALPDVATFSSVDVEKVVALAPDLVVAGGLGFTPADAITKLRSLGIPVLVAYASSIDGVYKDIELLGDATGQSTEADAITAGMRTDIDGVASAASAAATASGAKPRVFYDVGYLPDTGQIYGPAKGSFLEEMVSKLGVDVITSDPTTYEIPLEQLIERDPQVILVGVNAFYKPTAEEIAKRNGWGVLTAVKNGDIRPVNDTELTRPGPRLPTGLRNLTLAMYPDITLPPAP